MKMNFIFLIIWTTQFGTTQFDYLQFSFFEKDITCGSYHKFWIEISFINQIKIGFSQKKIHVCGHKCFNNNRIPRSSYISENFAHKNIQYQTNDACCSCYSEKSLALAVIAERHWTLVCAQIEWLDRSSDYLISVMVRVLLFAYKHGCNKLQHP